MSSTARVQKWRENNPVRYAYHSLKTNAKRRGIEFNLSFKDFKIFATKCELFDQRGRSKDSYHIDRIDINKGYHVDNIQLIPAIVNIKKYHKFDKYVKNISIFEPEEFQR